MLKRVDRDVFLHHFDALKCRIRQTDFARKLLEGLTAALLFDEFRKFFSELVPHADRVRPSTSHIWDNALYICFLSQEDRAA